jgi:hypothetical protein
VAEREGGPEGLVAFRDVERELGRELGGGVVEIGCPIEDGREEGGEVGDGGGGGEVGEALLEGERLPAHALGVGEDGHGHDEALDGLHEAEPLGVEAGFGVGHYYC